MSNGSNNKDYRKELLLRMYDQMFNDINRHIMVVWQSIGLVLGAIGTYALVGNDIITLDVASGLIILLCTWLIAHLHDSSYWYNRNLAIIANIERQFLDKSDLNNIHYYFGKHRPNNPMITHLNIQRFLAVVLACLVLFYHFSERFEPNFSESGANFELMCIFPYILVIVALLYIRYHKRRNNKKYSEFLQNSPGIDIDSSSAKYGVGHGFPDNKDTE